MLSRELQFSAKVTVMRSMLKVFRITPGPYRSTNLNAFDMDFCK